jgi:hypothetical protein
VHSLVEIYSHPYDSSSSSSERGFANLVAILPKNDRKGIPAHFHCLAPISMLSKSSSIVSVCHCGFFFFLVDIIFYAFNKLANA